MPTSEQAALHAQIDLDRGLQADEGPKLTRLRDYAEGDHALVLTDEQKITLEGLFENEFCDNVCHQIISEASDRLDFQGWECEDAAVAAFLADLYSTSQAEDRQGEIHYDTLRDGNHVLALEWDTARAAVRLYQEPWWNGEEGVFVAYDQRGDVSYAVKEWTDPATPNTRPRRRRLVWFDDRLERYVGDTGAWEPFRLDEDQGRWPVPWLKIDGGPLRIPYVHFPNAGRGSRRYGGSELAGGVLGFQDQLNSLQWDMSGGCRLTAFQMLALSDWAPGKDSEGNNIAPAVGPGQIFYGGPAFRASAIPAGDMSQMLSVYQAKLQRVAQITRTPLHAITGGDWPSGEALARAEQPAVGKAKRQVNKLKTRWVAVAHKATELYNRFGAGPKLQEEVQGAMITALFGPVERSTPAEMPAVDEEPEADEAQEQEAQRPADVG